jgi:hypothetical protein
MDDVRQTNPKFAHFRKGKTTVFGREGKRRLNFRHGAKPSQTSTMSEDNQLVAEKNRLQLALDAEKKESEKLRVEGRTLEADKKSLNEKLEATTTAKVSAETELAATKKKLGDEIRTLKNSAVEKEGQARDVSFSFDGGLCGSGAVLESVGHECCAFLGCCC